MCMCGPNGSTHCCGCMIDGPNLGIIIIMHEIECLKILLACYRRYLAR